MEDKQHKVPIGFAQNIKQLESTCEMNKKKRKRGDNDFDYLYGIVTTGRDWHFLLYSPRKISKVSDITNLIKFSRKALEPNSKSYQSLCDSVKEVLGIIVASEIDLLRQENTRLMAENAEFKAKYDEAKDEITKLRAELRNRIEELEKARIDTIAENTRRDDSSPEKSADIPDSIVANETVSANSKSSEEKIMDSFLDEVNKKRISDGIRQRKQEEKLAKMETIFPEKDEQVSVDKRMLCKENQKKQREKFIQKVSEDDSIPSVSSQRASTNCSNIIDEPGFNSLDVCLEKTIRNCDPLAVEMGTPTFSLLYEKLCDAVTLADHVTQEAIFCYYQFGKAFIQRRDEIASEKQVDPEFNTVSRILNIEVKAQLPAGTSDTLLQKRIEQVKKLYTLFNAIDNIPFDYSIHMETQLCEPSSQSDKKNSDLSHITSSDAPTESQIPNQSALKKFDTKVERI
ncbi:hypothetical protein GLOIN_2v1582864 [Rhizophagus clarus]|uniref:Uncharacterized protein n=1 Tax=Rhizophagus clarus TaxID=94130 RepID=A0A8H3QK74_9GLOM|nr:hypothetical protein GLOIN_2v1582864 [Rhizophagus clarus]